jgi:hypothetical protein
VEVTVYLNDDLEEMENIFFIYKMQSIPEEEVKNKEVT